jgi:hypothetical protein
MKTVEYMQATDFPFPVLYREIVEDRHYYHDCWSKKLQVWHKSGDALGGFIGFEPAKPITKEEAFKLIADAYGEEEAKKAMTEEKSEKAIAS